MEFVMAGKEFKRLYDTSKRIAKTATSEGRNFAQKRVTVGFDGSISVRCCSDVAVSDSIYQVAWGSDAPNAGEIAWLFLPDKIDSKCHAVYINITDTECIYKFDNADPIIVNTPVMYCNKDNIDFLIENQIAKNEFEPVCRINRKYLISILQNSDSDAVDICIGKTNMIAVKDKDGRNKSYLCKIAYINNSNNTTDISEQ